jgi:ribonuclease-3
MDAERKRALTAFQKNRRLKFRSLDALDQAFVHRSAANETGRRHNNERLEFLGDAILGAVTASLLYRRLPDAKEGELSKIKSVAVSEEVLAGVALELQIDRLLVMSRGEERTGGRMKKALLADAVEALIGALFLDSGFKAAETFVSALINPEIDRIIEKKAWQDYKSLLQEWCQKTWKSYPVYRCLKRSGPEHDKIFFVEVAVHGKTYGPATGRSKQGAEQEAAKIAYGEMRAGA